MVQFNELRIIPNGTRLIIDVSVRDLEYYTNVYLDSIIVDTQDTYLDSGPSSTPVYSKKIEGDVKSFRVEIGKGDLLPALDNNMFIVYVKTKGIPSADTPCGMDNEYTIGVTLWLCPMYDYMMGYVREVERKCVVPRNFINAFLRYKAFMVAINTNNYIQAIDYYNRYIRHMKKSEVKIDNCSCYD